MRKNMFDEIFQEYTDAIHNLNERRLHWREEAKTIVEKTLEEIAQRYSSTTPLGLYTQKYQLYHNMSAIQLFFGNMPNGLLLKTANKTQHLGVLKGPALVFGQGNDGRIYVSMYLFVDVLPNEKPRKPKKQKKPKKPKNIFLTVVEPQEITKELVCKLTKEFLVKALEKSHLSEPICEESKQLRKLLWSINQIPQIKNQLLRVGLPPVRVGTEFYDTILKIFFINRDEPVEIERFQIGEHGFILKQGVMLYKYIYQINFSRFANHSPRIKVSGYNTGS